MKIKEIEFGMLYSKPGTYDNFRIAIKAELQKGEDPGVILRKLQKEVETEVAAYASKDAKEYLEKAIKERKEEYAHLQGKLKQAYTLLSDPE